MGADTSSPDPASGPPTLALLQGLPGTAVARNAL